MASRTSTFVFKEPDQLRYTDFDFNQYTEFFEQDETSEEMLRNYIVNEAEAFRESMLEDLAELRREKENLGGKVGEAQQKNGILAQSARSIKRKFDEANSSFQTLDARYQTEKDANREASEQLSDIKKLIKGMNEAKAKYLKGCDKDSLKKIK
jgi:chromosome segregation ATPase